MKTQIIIFKNNLKKNYKWFIILILLITLTIILLKIKPQTTEINDKDFLSLLTFPGLGFKIDFFSFLLTLYQIGLTIYITYYFYTYELNNSLEYFTLRINEKKWFIQKSTILIIFLTLYKLISILIIYLFFKDLFNLQLNYILFPIIYQLLIIITTLFILTLDLKKRIIFTTLTPIILISLYIEFNLILAIIYLIIFYITSYTFFTFKRYNN